MWTPKRVLILVGSFFFFAILFGFYLHFFGYLDGLPQLPERFYPGELTQAKAVPPNQNDKILQAAFGDDCEELTRPILLFLRSKGLAFAAKKFEIDSDQRSSSRRSAPSSITTKAAAPAPFPKSTR